MNDLPLHPMLVHLPIALTILVPLLAMSMLVAWKRRWLPPRAWALVLMAQLLLVGSAVLAVQTGEAEEERAEAFASESAIEAHEEAAESFTWAAGAVLLVMALPLFVPQRFRFPAASLATAATVVTLVLGVRVGRAGGEIVYGARGTASATGLADGSAHVDHDDD